MSELPRSSAVMRSPPRSTRGRRTRAALVAAARAVFERDGLQDARIRDITETAGVAVGSFYTHFATREDIFAAVLAETGASLNADERATAEVADLETRTHSETLYALIA